MSSSDMNSYPLNIAVCCVVVLAVGATGNQDCFSCAFSPGSSSTTLSVAGTGKRSEMPLHGSNYGDCVDMYAPGEDIMAPFIGPSNSEERAMTGSSAATAIVSGLAARILHTIASIPRYARSYEVLIAQADSAAFLKRLLLSSSRLTGDANMGPAHPKAFYDCDITNMSTVTALLDIELGSDEFADDSVNKPVVPGISRAKERYLAMKTQKNKNQI